MPRTAGHQATISDQVLDLIQELLDAHCDTVCLAGELEPDSRWAAHVAYLKDLRRIGQHALAELA